MLNALALTRDSYKIENVGKLMPIDKIVTFKNFK